MCKKLVFHIAVECPLGGASSLLARVQIMYTKLFQGQFICVLSISKLRMTVSHDLAKISRCAHIVKIRHHR